MPRILVADDNSNIQKMVALALEERGIDVVSVGNGEAAVRRIPDLAPDLVLADVFMPVRNGYEVCEFVKTNERFAHVPVILLVGAFDPLDEKEARRVGADGVLKKPFVPPDPLIAMVTSALEKNPHVAAEMEKAREAPAPAPPEPEIPAIALEAPARVAPKPLPDFPEPSPEEAALIYGFEKKREKSDEDEDSRPRFSHKDREPEDDFDHAATARDWRRGVADFEIPDDLNSKAISPDENFSSAAFPSEHETAPKRVPFNHEDSGSETSAPATPPSFVPEFSTGDEETASRPMGFSSLVKSAAPPESTHAPQPESPAPSQPAPLAAEPESVPSSEIDPLPAPSEYAEDGWMSSLLGRFRRGKSLEHEHAPNAEAQPVVPASEPFAPASEAVAAAPAADDPTTAGTLPASTERSKSVALPAHEPNAPAPAASSDQEATDGRSDFFAQGSLSAPAADSYPAAAVESHPAPAAEHPAPAEFAAPATDSWFAPAAAPLNDLETADESASAFSTEPNRDLLASPADVNDDERSKFSDWADPSVEAKAAPDLESDASEYESESAYSQHPAYDKAPVAPESPVVPESEGHAPFSAVGDEHVSSSPTSSPADASPADERAWHASSNGNAVRDQLTSIFARPAVEPADHDSADSRSSDLSPAESRGLSAEESSDDSSAEFAHSASEPSERIPTAPPPNREAIADIPFLTPPPPAPFEPASSEAHKASEAEANSSEDAVGSAGADSASANGSSDSPSVDAVVNRLLEKLQPQIQNMLANDLLKPLVQNLLDQELSTKKK